MSISYPSGSSGMGIGWLPTLAWMCWVVAVQDALHAMVHQELQWSLPSSSGIIGCQSWSRYSLRQSICFIKVFCFDWLIAYKSTLVGIYDFCCKCIFLANSRPNIILTHLYEEGMCKPSNIHMTTNGRWICVWAITNTNVGSQYINLSYMKA